MSKIQMRLVQELPIITCWAEHNGQSIKLEALVDTGSAGTMLRTASAHALEIYHYGATGVYSVYGIGGQEVVYSHWLDRLIIGNRASVNVLAEVSGMDYGLPIDAIIGMDVLQSIEAIIKTGPLVIEFDE